MGNGLIKNLKLQARNALLCFALIVLFALPAFASTLHVPEEYSTIQSAIDAAVNFDTVLINDGTYTGNGNRDIDFRGKAIVVKSVTGANNTIIDCQADATTPHRGFIFLSGEDSLSVLEGLTIQNGFAPGDYLTGESNGAGIFCDSGSSPTIINCQIAHSVAFNSGGGMAIFNSSPTVIGCTFDSNTAYVASAAGIASYGGAVRCLQSSARFINCRLTHNRSFGGGGLSCNHSDIVLDSCNISNNIADIYRDREPESAGFGGGIHLFYSNPEIRFCELYDNIAKTLFSQVIDVGHGGGIALIYSSPHIVNCNITYNIAQWQIPTFYGLGAGIYCDSSHPALEQSIIAYNSQGAGVFIGQNSGIITECTDIFGNEYGDWIAPIDTLQSQYNNFSLDPQFCDPYSDDYQLSQSSPCLETNSVCGIRVGVNGLGCVTTGITDQPEPVIPKSFTLFQNYPNPFNSQTIISFDSLTKSPFHLLIYNLLGEVVYQLSGVASVGINSLVWNADTFASGIYFYSLKLGTNNLTRKMLLLK